MNYKSGKDFYESTETVIFFSIYSSLLTIVFAFIISIFVFVFAFAFAFAFVFAFTFAITADCSDETETTTPGAFKESPDEKSTAVAGKKNVGEKKSTMEFITGTLPPRKIIAGAFLMLGFVAPHGFLLGGDASLGWKLVRFLSLHIKLGGGVVQKRGVNMNTLLHGDIIFPIRLAICSHSPRVCPGLDFYISIVPGIGYGLLMQNRTSDIPFALLNHSINAILGLSLESIRTYGRMDAGVRFGIYLYIDFLKEDEEEQWSDIGALFELGIVIRWGKTT